MSQLIKRWFSSGGSPSPMDISKSEKDAQVCEEAHELVESALESLPMGSISAGDYYRLYRTLLDWSRQTWKLTGRTNLYVYITKFDLENPDTPPDQLANRVELSSIDCQLARWLVRTFSGVTTIQVHVNPYAADMDDGVMHCLLIESRRWAQQLIQLVYQPKQGRLWHALLPKLTHANFPHLKHLAMFGYSSMNMNDGTVIDLPILRQLTNFVFDVHDDMFDLLWPTLREHINEQRPPLGIRRAFWLYCPLREPLLYEVFCTMTSHFSAAIDALKLKLPPSPKYTNNINSSSSSAPPILSSLVRKFHGLVFFYLEIPNTGHYDLIRVVRTLASLKTLAYLELTLESYKQLPSAGDDKSDNDDVDVKRQARPELSRVDVVIKQVRHGSFHVPAIVGLFPAARPIGVAFLHCVTCGSRCRTFYSLNELNGASIQDSWQNSVDACWRHVLVGGNGGGRALEDDIRYNLFV